VAWPLFHGGRSCRSQAGIAKVRFRLELSQGSMYQLRWDGYRRAPVMEFAQSGLEKNTTCLRLTSFAENIPPESQPTQSQAPPFEAREA